MMNTKMKNAYQAPEDAVGAIASVLEAAMYLNSRPEGVNLSLELLDWAREVAEEAAKTSREQLLQRCAAGATDEHN